MRKLRLVVSILAIGLALAAGSGWMLVVDGPRKSDVIVVLAGETDRRPARGLQLLDQGFAGHLILDVPAAGQKRQRHGQDLRGQKPRPAKLHRQLPDRDQRAGAQDLCRVGDGQA